MTYADALQVCEPWTTADKLCCDDTTYEDCADGTQPLEFPWTDDDYILAASNILFNRTGHRYPGICERTVWPCVKCRCGPHPCGCGVYYAITLGRDYPVLTVSSVEIDGVPLAPADYRIDEYRDLVRVDGDMWPLCNSLGLPNQGQCPEMKVTFTTGREPPLELEMAAAELACELKKACNGSDSCTLPDHVRSISRRGVNLELQDVAALLSDGMTGNPIIDYALEVYGRKRGRATIVDLVEERCQVTLDTDPPAGP